MFVPQVGGVIVYLVIINFIEELKYKYYTNINNK
jgi:hypothetical protein